MNCCKTLIILLALMFTGCARLSAGDMKSVVQPGQLTPHVYLLRGYLDWYSTGMDVLTTELCSTGVDATTFREEQWEDLADAMIQHPHRPIVLIGFSFGADDVILISRKLNDRHLPVDLLITIDPVTPAAVPANVTRCVSFYEPNGFWDMFPWLRGVPLAADTGGHVENINIRARPELDEPGTSHGTIAANEKVHLAVVELVRSLK